MECPICLDTIDEESNPKAPLIGNACNYKKAMMLKCNHIFHKSCIDEWMKKNSTCPYCRSFLLDKINVKIKINNSFSKKASLEMKNNINNVIEDVVIKYKKYFSEKKFILNRYTIKEYCLLKNNIVVKFYMNYPKNLVELNIKFQKNETDYVSQILNKIIFQYNYTQNNFNIQPTPYNHNQIVPQIDNSSMSNSDSDSDSSLYQIELSNTQENNNYDNTINTQNIQNTMNNYISVNDV